MNPVLLAFLLTTIGGLSTGIGSAIPFLFKSIKKSFLAFSLGLSAGVMIFVSFSELLPSALENMAIYWAFLAFFGGMGVVAIIDFTIPHEKNPHHMTTDCEGLEKKVLQECLEEQAKQSRVDKTVTEEEIKDDQTLLRTGILTALAIAIHNFPEGIATFATALNDATLGISITIAIAIHNVPEGISVSIPIYYTTRSKWKSFGLSLASGLAEPLGALLAYAILRPFLTEFILGVSLAVVSGIMVYISIDELIPVAHEYGKGDIVMVGIVVGMLLMAGSLILFEVI
ncbi:MAG: zinc transporter ZupT [Asgard group archaeon]|nr:zinc transporter ZupT [Asgard group archaeon]